MKLHSVFSKSAVLAATCIALAGPAKADVTWLVDGVFEDGATVSGHFTIDTYGFLLSNFSLVTTAGSLPGYVYNSSDSYYSSGSNYVDFQPGYEGDLHLTFLNSLSTASLNNAITGGSPGPSWECTGSFSCYVPSGGTIRYISSGSASAVPETATWAMMLAGFATLGFAGYRRSKTERLPRPVA